MIDLVAIDMNASETEIVEQVNKMLTSDGFLYLKNVDGFDEQALLEATKAFYSIPLAERQKLVLHNFDPKNNNIYRGIAPFFDNNEAHKEFFDMGRRYEDVSDSEKKYPIVEPTPFLPETEYQWIRERFEKQWALMHGVALKLTRYIAIGLGKSQDIFLPWFEKDCLSTLRSIHILPRKAGIVDSSKLNKESLRLTTPAHQDSGFITILSTFGYPGLEVLIGDKFKAVRPKKNHLVVNLGITFEQMTNGQYKATTHRVLDIDVERFSMPFFLRPKYSAVIPSNFLRPQDAGTSVVFGDDYVHCLDKFGGEWKGLLKSIAWKQKKMDKENKKKK